jgi:hypothetical protein
VCDFATKSIELAYMVQKLALNLRFIGLQISTTSLALAICQCQQDKLRNMLEGH